MMSAIRIDRRAVCAGHDFEGMTLEYFWNFLLTEYIPAFADELSEEEIRQIRELLVQCGLTAPAPFIMQKNTHKPAI